MTVQVGLALTPTQPKPSGPPSEVICIRANEPFRRPDPAASRIRVHPEGVSRAAAASWVRPGGV